jgi:hypothetical protein
MKTTARHNPFSMRHAVVRLAHALGICAAWDSEVLIVKRNIGTIRNDTSWVAYLDALDNCCLIDSTWLVYGASAGEAVRALAKKLYADAVVRAVSTNKALADMRASMRQAAQRKSTKKKRKPT